MISIDLRTNAVTVEATERTKAVKVERFGNILTLTQGDRVVVLTMAQVEELLLAIKLAEEPHE